MGGFCAETIIIFWHTPTIRNEMLEALGKFNSQNIQVEVDDQDLAFFYNYESPKLLESICKHVKLAAKNSLSKPVL